MPKRRLSREFEDWIIDNQVRPLPSAAEWDGRTIDKFGTVRNFEDLEPRVRSKMSQLIRKGYFEDKK